MMTHGIRSSYTNGHCRCTACRLANAVYARAFMAQPQWRLYMQRKSHANYLKRRGKLMEPYLTMTTNEREIMLLGAGPLEPAAPLPRLPAGSTAPASDKTPGDSP